MGQFICITAEQIQCLVLPPCLLLHFLRCLVSSKIMNSYDVLTIGDAKLDTFLTINENNPKCRLDETTKELCFKHGEKISVEHTHFSVGGNGANVTVGLSRLGIKATIAAETGD